MDCPVCTNELVSLEFTVDALSRAGYMYHCRHCECNYELRPDGDKQAWWKCTKLPMIADDSKAKYKLYEIESVCTGEVTDEFPLGQFEVQRERFSCMSSSYMDGEGYELVIAREDEFDEDGIPTFEMDERVICYQGDCGKRLHRIAARNVKRWQDVLAT